jgi:hypothetical protein
MTKNEKIQKDLMLGLIYPAVLGGILYLCLDQFAVQFSILWNKGFSYSLQHYEAVVGWKFFLLVVTVAFYIFDYLYITFTNEYRWWFFYLDLFFVVVLYFTIFCIDIAHTNTTPNYKVILFYYLSFMFLYWTWDSAERKIVEKEKGPKDEEYRLYSYIVLWEKISIAAIGVSWALSLIFDSSDIAKWATLVVVLPVTTCFGIFSIWKKKFYNPLGHEGQNTREAQQPFPPTTKEGSESSEITTSSNKAQP